jgi:hypothetical protein
MPRSPYHQVNEHNLTYRFFWQPSIRKDYGTIVFAKTKIKTIQEQSQVY